MRITLNLTRSLMPSSRSTAQFLVIAHGTPNEVQLARELLATTNPDRIDHQTPEIR
jgi:hypothetical protein